MSTWINAPEKAPEDKTGFVYEIVEADTHKKYIGIKRFWKTNKLKPLKGKKNKRHKIVETDWRIYNSSNEEMQENIKKCPKNYQKRIIKICDSITEMKATEAYLQLSYYMNGEWDVLYNEIINLRLRIR